MYDKQERIVSPTSDTATQSAQAERSSRLYSFQLGSFPEKEAAVHLYKRIAPLPNARVEKIGQYYTVRFGHWQSREQAETFRAGAHQHAPDAFLRTADLNHTRTLVQSMHRLPGRPAFLPQLPTAELLMEDLVQDFHVRQHRSDRLTINLEQTPLAGVLETIGLTFDIKITLESPVEEITVAQFTDSPIEQGLHKILKGRNYVFIYDGEHGPQLKEVIVHD